MNVSAVIVTRGDVDLDPIMRSLDCFDEIIVWNNGHGIVARVARDGELWASSVIARDQPDISVFGRYAAIEHATHDVIYVQDDDVIVSEPGATVEAWHMARCFGEGIDSEGRDLVVANMPPEFRHNGYTDSCLVGFGACFHSSLPGRCFERFLSADIPASVMSYDNGEPSEILARECDAVFTTLAPHRVLVDVPKVDREFASDPSRLWRQPDHHAKRVRMLELARKVRNGG